MKKLSLSSRLMTLVLGIFVLTATSKVMTQDYPFALPATVTATLNVTTQKTEVANNKLLGANIGGFTSTDEKALVKKFDPITIRFPSGVWINWYDWMVDGSRRYDDYVAKTYKGVPDSTYINMINSSQNSRTGFPGLTALNTEKKQLNGSGYSMIFGYNLNYDSNKKSADRLKDSEEKGFNVEFIEMGNEMFYGNQCSYQTNSSQKYTAVAKSLSDTLRKIKPSIKLSVPLSWRPESGTFNATLTADTTYFDAVSIHKYVGSDPDKPVTFTYKDVLAGRLLLEKDVNVARKLANTKPVWLTEWGVSAGSEFQAAAGLGMADCYLFLYENQKIYGRADWYCINGLLNSFVSFIPNTRTIKYPLEKTGYGSVHEILRSVFENSTLLGGSMSTTKISTSLGSTNAVSARVVEKDGKRIAFAVNLTNKPVVFNMQFDGVAINQHFTHEALVFDSLSQDHAIGIDVNPLTLIKEGTGTITLPALSVSRIKLNGPADYIVKFQSPVNGTKMNIGTDFNVTANAGSAVTSVSLFLNKKLVRNITGAPYKWGEDKVVDAALKNLVAGSYNLKLVAANADTISFFDSITIAIKDTAKQYPYKGIIQIPGTVEAENYDIGGEGESYHDSNVGNTGNLYRTDDVDVGSFGTGLYNVGWTANGEWLEYTVNVAETGLYDVDIVYSAGRTTPAKIGLELFDEGKTLFSDFTLPTTTTWDKYVTLPKQNVQLTQGKHILRLNITVSGCNIDKLIFSKVAAAGTETVQMVKVKAFPNPSADGQFNLSKHLKWEVYSLEGIKIKDGVSNQINLSGFPKGLYLLKAENAVQKLISGSAN